MNKCEHEGEFARLARMTNYPYWHQIQDSQSDEQRHWWQAQLHCSFQRHHQAQATQEEEKRAHEA